MRNDDQKTSLILTVCGILPVVWLALLTAPYVSGGLVEIIRGLPVAMGNPFEIAMCEDSVKTVLIFLLASGMGIGIYSPGLDEKGNSLAGIRLLEQLGRRLSLSIF